jgi:hypothetical protein
MCWVPRGISASVGNVLLRKFQGDGDRERNYFGLGDGDLAILRKYYTVTAKNVQFTVWHSPRYHLALHHIS